jgi:ABC-2 type transport system ATP-binding protein
MIQVRQLTKRYRATSAVDGLTFEVKPGYVAGFLGPNGAGKSTTMRAILGLDRPTSGEALVDGRRYADIHRPLHHVGALLDAGAVHGGRSAYDHLRVLARSNGIKDSRVVATLEQVGLAGVARRRVGSLSLGMKQRLGVAAALLGDPGVLLFDEPVNGLDPEGIRWIRHLMRDLAREGRTVLVSSHLMSEMALTADRVIVIGRGKLILEASMRDLQEKFRKDVLVRSPRPDALAAVLAAAGATARPEDGALLVQGLDAPSIADLAAHHHIPIHELTPRSASLEDAYLELTEDSTEYRTDPRPADSRPADSRPADSRTASPRPADGRPAEFRSADGRPAEPRTTETAR